MSREPGTPDLAIVDLLLGEGGEAERSRLRHRIATEPALAEELAGVADLLDSCRGVSVEPTGRVFRTMALRAGIRARRNQPPPPGLPFWGRLVGVCGVAAAVLPVLINDPFGLLAPGPSPAPSENALALSIAVRTAPPAATEPIEPAPRLAEPTPVLPVDEASFHLAYGRFAGLSRPDALEANLRATNEIALLGVEFENRLVAQRRRQKIADLGGNPDIDDRIQELARLVAEQITRQLARGEATVLETSLALRALLASGSDGHDAALAGCADWLVAGLDTWRGGELASAVSALSELAAVDVLDPDREPLPVLVRRHTRRLAEETVRRRNLEHHRRARPSLLSFEVPVASLADAGRLLYLAPAFGVPSNLAFEARRLVLAHLEERLHKSENAGALAAQLYGFGDLIGRLELDRRLKLWEIANLDYVTVHHLAWSRFPVRPGWARFQQDLRRLSAQPNPETAGESAALLLCLAMNVAAPGAAEMLLTQQ